ncbi:hypothetical protein Goari_022725 [Gossypium aridum]|uniref:Zinc knuckle CX2CX4HX4C domain-containing protein n=1 Tax=Gossypium aridum TaxID=34290 RepID=A0A7J8YQX8_GOSAI|nr:hypothetical protein [Gossypium aridum]
MMEDAMANLKLLNDEEEAIHEVEGSVSAAYQFCLTFLRIRVRLDVIAPLKRKKKVLFGKSMVVYARFKYEKLSLFCFICGRLGRNFRGVAVNQNVNPNLIPLGSGQYYGNSRLNNGCDGGNDMMVADGAVYGPMDLVLNEEDDPIALLEGKKRQRIVESSRVLLDAIVGLGFMDVSASSGDQSSRAQ